VTSAKGFGLANRARPVESNLRDPVFPIDVARIVPKYPPPGVVHFYASFGSRFNGDDHLFSELFEINQYAGT
jgi:hypothetical protein